MKKISANIVTFNNEDAIANTIKAVINDEIEVNIGDLGSTDNTLGICNQYNVNIVKLNYKIKSDAINHLVSKSYIDWQLYLIPGETIKSGIDAIYSAIQHKGCYSLFVVKNNIVTKSARLWHKRLGLQFINPVYEFLDVEQTITIDCILDDNAQDDTKTQEIDDWIKNNPLSSAPYYYKAFYNLENKDYEKFMLCSDKYLFIEKSKNISWLLIRYYRAYILFKVHRKYKNAIDEINLCLSVRQDIAEFWCLLADILYFGLYDFEQAMKFYNNAIANGKNRDIRDSYPVEPLKYNDYPQQRIKDCLKAISDKKVYMLS